MGWSTQKPERKTGTKRHSDASLVEKLHSSNEKNLDDELELSRLGHVIRTTAIGDPRVKKQTSLLPQHCTPPEPLTLFHVRERGPSGPGPPCPPGRILGHVQRGPTNSGYALSSFCRTATRATPEDGHADPSQWNGHTRVSTGNCTPLNKQRLNNGIPSATTSRRLPSAPGGRKRSKSRNMTSVTPVPLGKFELPHRHSLPLGLRMPPSRQPGRVLSFFLCRIAS